MMLGMNLPNYGLGCLLVFGAYLSGAVPYGLLICKVYGIDIREIGSGNIGATNAARALGKRWGIFILLLDALKGFLPSLLAKHLLNQLPGTDMWLAGVMVAAVIGHMFPIFLFFRGGKGVATGLGVILAVSPWAGLVGIILYVGLYAIFHISSVGSLVGCIVAPLVMFLTKTPLPLILTGITISLLVFLKHLPNISRIVRGEEGKV